MRYLTWGLLALLVLMYASFATSRIGQQTLDDEERASLGGHYLPTEQGTLSYTRRGPADAPAVVLIHGFSTPKFVWDQVTPKLLAAGHQVITYDHLGRGFSDRPPGPYDGGLFRRELTALIDGLQLATPLSLVGYSMGGAIAVDFSAVYPTQVNKLVLVAPAGYLPESIARSLLHIPLLGEWLAQMYLVPSIRAEIGADVAAGRAPATMLDDFDRQANYAGYARALLSTLRHFPMSGLDERFRAVGSAGIPVTAIWGTEDQVTPYSGAARLQRDVPQTHLVTLDGGRHNITYVQPELVARHILQALASNPGPGGNP
jgi:pimeloyl-ACP methyl ester carboxylesterase